MRDGRVDDGSEPAGVAAGGDPTFGTLEDRPGS